MNKIKKLSKSFFVLAIILLLFFSVKYEVNASEGIYTATSNAKNGDIVYFEKPSDWGDSIPYIFAWDNYRAPNNQLGGNFPGVAMTLVSGNLYKYEFTNDIAYAQLIFSSPDLSKQTVDLDYICNGYIYTFDSTKEQLAFNQSSVYKNDTLYFEKPDSWTNNIFIYMWNSGSGNNNGDWKSKSMTNVSGNLYSYTITDSDWNSSNGYDMVIFADDNFQTKNLNVVNSDLIFKANASAISSGDDTGKYDGIWVYTSEQLSALTTLISQTTVPASDESYYTKDSYKIYKEQFDLAKTVSESDYVAATYFDLTSQYNKSLIALRFAYDNLQLDTTILSNKIDEMKNVDTSKYEQSLVDNFNTSIQNSEALLNDTTNLTVAKIKEAISNMESTYNSLVVDKSELEDLINKAKDIDTTLYTEESVKNFVDSLNQAIATFENQDSSHNDVQDQIKSLNNSISNLQLKDEENTGDTTDKDETNDDKTDNKTEDENVNNTEEEKKEDNKNSYNPSTGDIIFLLAGVLTLAIITFIITTLYAKKQKNK